nr:hypothetical protein [Atribacterota bacterium]
NLMKIQTKLTLATWEYSNAQVASVSFVCIFIKFISDWMHGVSKLLNIFLVFDISLSNSWVNKFI